MRSLVFLVQLVLLIPAHHLLSYETVREQLLTLEGLPGSLPHVIRENYKRTITFNNDGSNIRVEMLFAVPFLRIPIGAKAMEGPYGSEVSPIVDINVKSLITASVLLFVLFFVVPKLVRVFVPSLPQGRGLEESDIGRLIRGVESVLHVNATACWQQGVCAMVQASRPSDLSGPTPNWAKIVDGISNFKMVERITSGSSFGEALASAKRGAEGCMAYYKECRLSGEAFEKLSKQLARRYINHFINMSKKVVST